MKKMFLFISCVVFMAACQKGRSYFPKDIEPQEIEIVRFDNALVNPFGWSISWVFRAATRRTSSNNFRRF